MAEKKFLTLRETAAYLDIPEGTMVALNAERKITYYRCGKRCYYDIDDIHAYIMRNKIPAGSSKTRLDSKGKRPKKEIGYKAAENTNQENQE